MAKVMRPNATAQTKTMTQGTQIASFVSVRFGSFGSEEFNEGFGVELSSSSTVRDGEGANELVATTVTTLVVTTVVTAATVVLLMIVEDGVVVGIVGVVVAAVEVVDCVVEDANVVVVVVVDVVVVAAVVSTSKEVVVGLKTASNGSRDCSAQTWCDTSGSSTKSGTLEKNSSYEVTTVNLNTVVLGNCW